MKPKNIHQLREDLRITLLVERIMGTRDRDPELLTWIRSKNLIIMLDDYRGERLNTGMFPEITLLLPDDWSLDKSYGIRWDLQSDKLQF